MNAPAINPIDTIDHAVLANLTPQAVRLLEHITKHGSVTQREALLDLSVQSLTKRIHELRKHFVIVSDARVHKTSKQRYVRYFYKGAKPKKQVADALARPMPEDARAYEGGGSGFMATPLSSHEKAALSA